MNIENCKYLECITRKGEVWAQIPGYPYLISNLGRVYGLERNQLEQGDRTYNGYHRVTLSKNGKTTHKRISLLVAEAFCGGVPKGKRVHHINRHRSDNRAVNLIVCTEQEHRAIHNLYTILGAEYVESLTAEQLYRMCHFIVNLCEKIGGEAA